MKKKATVKVSPMMRAHAKICLIYNMGGVMALRSMPVPSGTTAKVLVNYCITCLN